MRELAEIDGHKAVVPRVGEVEERVETRSVWTARRSQLHYSVVGMDADRLARLKERKEPFPLQGLDAQPGRHPKSKWASHGTPRAAGAPYVCSEPTFAAACPHMNFMQMPPHALSLPTQMSAHAMGTAGGFDDCGSLPPPMNDMAARCASLGWGDLDLPRLAVG